MSTQIWLATLCIDVQDSEIDKVRVQKLVVAEHTADERSVRGSIALYLRGQGQADEALEDLLKIRDLEHLMCNLHGIDVRSGTTFTRSDPAICPTKLIEEEE